MGSGKEMCLLLLLLLLLLENPCFADGSSRFVQGNKKGLSSNPARIHRTHYKGVVADEDNVGDEVFGAEKRRVYTGPNPLHNR
ncbi:CLAVATA3/ESR-RELATED 17 [Salvia divinorum]|uniref:CLAVATA3/ESR-RELATED 17 n=1 Tax=Salvia divinorum TaxID=28513 RepID=A0ABD1FIP2_SALDI